MEPSDARPSFTAASQTVLGKRTEEEVQETMRRHRSALVLSIVVSSWFVIVGVQGEHLEKLGKESPGDWAARHREQFLQEYLRGSPELLSGERISILMYGDYQCETRLIVRNDGEKVAAEVVVVRGENVQSQLTTLRAESHLESSEAIFRQVRLGRERITSAEAPILEELWGELVTLDVPVVPKSGLLSPAVWYDVTSSSADDLHFQFPLPVPNALSTGFIIPPKDPSYKRIGTWVRKVLAAFGGDAAAAADGGDCGLTIQEKINVSSPGSVGG